MESEPLRILLNFDRWATHRIFAACKPLSDQELDAEFSIGLGSLRKTLAHVVACMDWWIDHCQQTTIRPFASDAGSLDDMYHRYGAAWEQLTQILADSNLDRMDEVLVDSFDNAEYGKGTLRYRRSAVLLHIFNHGTHHRSQCLFMLRQLGVHPLPEIDLIDSHQEVERMSSGSPI
jgi:uncharacterized damage-inducible protein DinB